ncbi:MAG: M16 family metallopeptidase, partial [Thermoflexibacteraceae bacterium]
FEQHPLGYNILGTMESVQSFDKTSLQQFIHENLNTSQIIFSVVSPLPTSKVFALAEKYLAHLPIRTGKTQRKPMNTYQPKQIQQKKAISQAHCMIGTVAYSLHHPKRLALVLLNNILGGNSMNSRLNMTLREKHGLVYAIESNYHPFTDTGQLAIYFGTEKNTMEKSIDLVMKELAHLRNKKLGAMQLHKAKGQLMGQLAMGEESNLSLMLMFGKSLLDLNYIESLPHVFKEIEALSADTICEVANELLAEENLLLLSYLPQ